MSKRSQEDAVDGSGDLLQQPPKLPRKEVDADLELVFDALDTSPKSQKLLLEQCIHDVPSLLANAHELAETALVGINKTTQKQLHLFCLWYDDFHKKDDTDGGWKEHFDEDTINQFEKDRLQAVLQENSESSNSNGKLEEDLEKVCEEIDLPKHVRLKLAANGIKSVSNLVERQTVLEVLALPYIKKTTQKTLLKFCTWYEEFNRKKKDDSDDWRDHFNDTAFAEFEQEPGVEKNYRLILGRLHEGRGDGGIDEVSKEVVDHAATISTRYLSERLIAECKGKFNPQDVAFKCVKALLHPTGKVNEIIHVVSGKTQSGKSTVKAVCAVVHRQLDCFLIVITKGISERDDLKIKLNKLLGGARETMDNGRLVIADTGNQIAKAIKAVREIRISKPNARFGVVVDECDAMHRTKDCSQLMEQRFADLMDLGPSFRMEVSATPYSAVQALADQGREVEMMMISTVSDYSGVEKMRCFEDDGIAMHLNAKELTPRSDSVRYEKSEGKMCILNTPFLFSSEREINPNCKQCQGPNGCDKHSDIIFPSVFKVSSTTRIPYTNKPMMQLLDAALPCTLSSMTPSAEDRVDCHGLDEVSKSPSDALSDAISKEPSEDMSTEGTKETQSKNDGTNAPLDENNAESTESSDQLHGKDGQEDGSEEDHESTDGSEEGGDGLDEYDESSTDGSWEEDESNEGSEKDDEGADGSNEDAVKDVFSEYANVLNSLAENPSKKQGVLVLVATDPRVYAEGNVFTQAACIQNTFHNKGKPFVAIVATGRGIFFRFPHCTKGRFIARRLKTASEVITRIDEVVGLNVPIVIFGYSRMCRCVSFRSSIRVPTHMILSRGPGYSLEDFIQALGRATFNGLSVLNKNGHDFVTVLTGEDDFLSCKKYYRFLQELYMIHQANPTKNIAEVYLHVQKKFSDEANFFRHTNRKIGRRKDLKDKGPRQDAFEDPLMSEDVQKKREKYWTDAVAQKLMTAFYQLSEQRASFSCTTDELLQACHQLFPLEESASEVSSIMTKTVVKQKLSALERDVIFAKNKADDSNVFWVAKSISILEFMLNDSFDDASVYSGEEEEEEA